MRLHRFIGQFDFSKKDQVIHDAELANQLWNVLRLTAGDSIILCDGNGNDAVCRINEPKKGAVVISIERIGPSIPEPETAATLYCSVLKRENFELVAQKATEIGIARIVPIITEHTVKLSLNSNRVRKIIKEAAEQSGRGIVPEFSEPMPLSEALHDARANRANLFFDVSGKALGQDRKAGSVGVFIGPEGGWGEKELEAAEVSGCRIVSLGSFTLRAETAAIVAAYSALQNSR